MDGYDRLNSAQQRVISSQNAHKAELSSQITDYHELKKTLLNLRDNYSKPCYVPFGGVSNKRPKCFLQGKLVKTNEVMMLLGDGYFLQTTVKNATEIIDSRIGDLKEKVDEFSDSGKKMNEYKDLGVELKYDDEKTRKFDEMMMEDTEFTEEDKAELMRLENNYKKRWENNDSENSQTKLDSRFTEKQKQAWQNPEFIKKQQELKERAKKMSSFDNNEKSPVATVKSDPLLLDESKIKNSDKVQPIRKSVN